jgi:hypothetical protein
VHAWGNPSQRRRALGSMLSFAHKRFDDRVPEPGERDAEDWALRDEVGAAFEKVGEQDNLPLKQITIGRWDFDPQDLYATLSPAPRPVSS